MDTTASLVIASFVIIVLFFFSQNKSGRTPPGPVGLPIVGYIPFMTSAPYIELQKLSKVYGPVYSVQLGSQNVIVLSDFQSTKDAFAQDAFMGRPPENPFQLRKATLETGAFNGLAWIDQRNFSLQLLKDLGFGKSHLEDMVKEEITDLLIHIEESKGHPMFIKTLLIPSTSNNIASLVFGKRRKYDDPVRIKLDKTQSESSTETNLVAWQIFFPWITKLMRTFGLGREKQLRKIFEESRNITLKGYFFHDCVHQGMNQEFKVENIIYCTHYIKDSSTLRAEIEEHERTLDENNVRDYIDGYLIEIRKRKEPAFCKEVLEDIIGAFFGAGSETIQLTMNWLMLTMAAYTDVQKRVQDEIDNVVGRTRMPSWNDETKMPYTQATIMELMRWRTISPFTMRYTLWDTELNDYFIPKNSFVLANLWAIHHDPYYWGRDVEIFHPERFLTEDEKGVIKPEYFVPFSVGKRACPGESYARMEIFLYFTSILQKFNVSLPEEAVPDFDGELKTGLSPKPYELCLHKRY